MGKTAITHPCPTCDEPKRVEDICLVCNAPEPEPLCTDCGLHVISNSDHGLCDYCLEESKRVVLDEMALRDSLEQQFR